MKSCFKRIVIALAAASQALFGFHSTGKIINVLLQYDVLLISELNFGKIEFYRFFFVKVYPWMALVTHCSTVIIFSITIFTHANTSHYKGLRERLIVITYLKSISFLSVTSVFIVTCVSLFVYFSFYIAISIPSMCKILVKRDENGRDYFHDLLINQFEFYEKCVTENMTWLTSHDNHAETLKAVAIIVCQEQPLSVETYFDCITSKIWQAISGYLYLEIINNVFIFLNVFIHGLYLSHHRAKEILREKNYSRYVVNESKLTHTLFAMAIETIRELLFESKKSYNVNEVVPISISYSSKSSYTPEKNSDHDGSEEKHFLSDWRVDTTTRDMDVMNRITELERGGFSALQINKLQRNSTKISDVNTINKRRHNSRYKSMYKDNRFRSFKTHQESLWKRHRRTILSLPIRLPKKRNETNASKDDESKTTTTLQVPTNNPSTNLSEIEKSIKFTDERLSTYGYKPPDAKRQSSMQITNDITNGAVNILTTPKNQLRKDSCTLITRNQSIPLHDALPNELYDSLYPSSISSGRRDGELFSERPSFFKPPHNQSILSNNLKSRSKSHTDTAMKKIQLYNQVDRFSLRNQLHTHESLLSIPNRQISSCSSDYEEAEFCGKCSNDRRCDCNKYKSKPAHLTAAHNDKNASDHIFSGLTKGKYFDAQADADQEVFDHLKSNPHKAKFSVYHIDEAYEVE